MAQNNLGSTIGETEHKEISRDIYFPEIRHHKSEKRVSPEETSIPLEMQLLIQQTEGRIFNEESRKGTSNYHFHYPLTEEKKLNILYPKLEDKK